MQKLLLILLLFFSQTVWSQRGVLYVKKKGFKTVKRFDEGAVITFQTKNGRTVTGAMALVNKDSIYVNGSWFATGTIKRIFLREKTSFKINEIFLWATAGVALSTAGMTLAKWTDFNHALLYSAGLGYGNYLIRFFPKLSRRKFVLGKMYTLQTLDLHF
jgi:hypothetical protein